MDWHHDLNSLYMSDTDFESDEDDEEFDDMPELVKDIQIYNGYGHILFFSPLDPPDLLYLNSLYL
jgi:hypothetical protein